MDRMDTKKCWSLNYRDTSTDEIVAECVKTFYGTLKEVQDEINKALWYDWYDDYTFCGENGDVYYELVGGYRKED